MSVISKKAFTLIELLVVVAIIGILAAVGVTTFNGFQLSAKKSATIQQWKTVSKFIQYQLKVRYRWRNTSAEPN